MQTVVGGLYLAALCGVIGLVTAAIGCVGAIIIHLRWTWHQRAMQKPRKKQA